MGSCARKYVPRGLRVGTGLGTARHLPREDMLIEIRDIKQLW